jgi:hypothetical protein
MQLLQAGCRQYGDMRDPGMTNHLVVLRKFLSDQKVELPDTCQCQHPPVWTHECMSTVPSLTAVAPQTCTM